MKDSFVYWMKTKNQKEVSNKRCDGEIVRRMDKQRDQYDNGRSKR